MRKLTIIVGLVGLLGCSEGAPPFAPTIINDPPPVPFYADEENSYPPPTDGGRWAAFCAPTPKPTCNQGEVAVCVGKQNGRVRLPYVWECLPESWWTKQGGLR